MGDCHPWRTEGQEGFHSTPSLWRCGHLPPGEDRRLTVTKENIVPAGCSEQPRAELHSRDAAKAARQPTWGWQQPAVCPGERSGHPRLPPAAAPAVPPPQHNPPCGCSVSWQEGRGQLIWVTAKPEKEREKTKKRPAPHSSLQHNR